jgi:hypothetical protein
MRLSEHDGDAHAQPAFFVEMPKSNAIQNGHGATGARLAVERAFERTAGPDCANSCLTRGCTCTRAEPVFSVVAFSANVVIGVARTDRAKTAATIHLAMPGTPVCRFSSNLDRANNPAQRHSRPWSLKCVATMSPLSFLHQSRRLIRSGS